MVEQKSYDRLVAGCARIKLLRGAWQPTINIHSTIPDLIDPLLNCFGIRTVRDPAPSHYPFTLHSTFPINTTPTIIFNGAPSPQAPPRLSHLALDPEACLD